MKNTFFLVLFLIMPFMVFSSPTEEHDQILIVLSPSWHSIHGKMVAFSRNSSGVWQQDFGPEKVNFGSNGLAWSHGLHGDVPQDQAAPVRKLFDRRSPAGIYQFNASFSNEEAHAALSNLPHLFFGSTAYWVADPESEFFNTFQDTQYVARNWGYCEELGDASYTVPYKWGLTTSFNQSPIVPELGSAIFFHVWRTPSTPTAGCTAMSEVNMLKLIKWLDQTKKPIYAQMPVDEYVKNKESWDLPEINTDVLFE